MDRAAVLNHLGRYSEALDALQRVLPDVERAVGPDNMGVLRVLGHTAQSLIELGRVREAEPFVERATRICAARGSACVAEAGWLAFLRGQIELALGDTKGAELDDRRSLESSEKRSDTLGVVDSLALLGRVARVRGVLREELAYERRAVETLDRQYPDHAELAPRLIALGETLALRGDDDEAERTLERALTIFEPHPSDPQRRRRAVALLGRIRAGKALRATSR